MKKITKIKTIFSSIENRIFALISLAIFANTFFFVSREVKMFSSFRLTKNTDPFYLLYFILAVLSLGAYFFFMKNKFDLKNFAKTSLAMLLPSELLFIFAFTQTSKFHYIFFIAVGLYAIIAGTYLLTFRKLPWQTNTETNEDSSKNKRLIAGLILSIMLINFGFGFYNLGKFAAVDEPLWTFGRIQRFWNNVIEREWSGTEVSDKPGITVSIISGAGLIWENPRKNRPVSSKGEVTQVMKDPEGFNRTFRLPILLFTVFMLPVIFFFLKKLLGEKTAIFSFIFLGLSPILIGMSKIINPDSLLWIFTTLSLLSYLVFLKERTRKFLFFTGLFLGLALLTKYIANILIVFFFGAIFLEYIFKKEKYREIGIKKYLTTSLLDLIELLFIGIAIYYILLPANWLDPGILLRGTILSQAFETTWPLFVAIVGLIAADILILKGKISTIVLDFLATRKAWIISAITTLFLLSMVIVVSNTFLEMPFFDFEAALASPKTAYIQQGFFGIFFANFYSLIFGISGLALLFVSTLCAKNIFSKTKNATVAYLLLFILLYYLGSTMSHVTSTVRYQIILFPIILILAGMGLSELLLKIKLKQKTVLAIAILIGSLFFSLWSITPFYLSYSSDLLPKKYYLDLKDMGTGSYEVAQYLNSLPNPQKLSIWTDKVGVCSFFKGRCYKGFTFENFADVDFDFVVVSSGRQVRTTNIVNNRLKLRESEEFRFSKYYDQTEGITYQLIIDNRPEQFIKVLKVSH